MDIIVLLQQAVLNHASDIFVVAGLPVSYRANGRICREKEEKLMPPQTKECVEELYKLAGGRDIRVLEEKGDDDFSFAVPGLSRFRVSAYKQRGALSAVIRVITFELPEPNEIGIPDPVMSFYNLSKGLVLVTGPAGSGKSTTLACLVDKINHSMEKHIITLEDPIEYLHRHDKSIVSQREINVDTESYVNALTSGNVRFCCHGNYREVCCYLRSHQTGRIFHPADDPEELLIPHRQEQRLLFYSRM